MDPVDDPAARRREWFRYYSEKRIVHQWFQVHLLAGLEEARTVLEVGPNLGLVTALLVNAGFEVTTLDLLPPRHGLAGVAHIQADLREVAPEALAGFDCLLCCETLEHLAWHEVDGVLAKFAASAVPHLVISLPYQGFQLDARIYLNAHRLRQYFAFKKFNFLRRFRPHDDPTGNHSGHQWEIGYRGHSLAAFEAKLEAAGLIIERRDFTSPTRSVFYLLGRR
jgi:hypothetical protein